MNRAVDILLAFSRNGPELSLTEICKLTGLPSGTAFRLISTLKQRGFIQQDRSTGRYSIGPELLLLVTHQFDRSYLRTAALPVMRQIRDSVNETVILSIRLGYYRVHIEQVESFHPIRRVADIGHPYPLYLGASGKVLLACMADDEIDDYLSRVQLVKLTEQTVTTPEALWKQIRFIRERGFIETFGERVSGGVGVGAPVRHYTGRVCAALHVSTPITRYTDELRDRIIRCVLEGAQEISRRLGYRG